MEETTTKAAPLPRRQDLDALVYTAFMGHEPRVVPPEELAGDPWHEWAVLRPFNGPRWQHVRQICNDSILSPPVRERLAPLLVRAKKRWAEARARLLAQRNRVARAGAKSFRTELSGIGGAARSPRYS